MNVRGRDLRRGMLVKGCGRERYEDGPCPVGLLSEWDPELNPDVDDELGLLYPGGSFLFLDLDALYKVIFR